MSSANWAQTVSHEVGGHHDAWHELVAKVGATQAWTDYYDLDYFGKIWAEGRYKAVEGTARNFTLSEGKELYLDCVGPVSHGYPGNYLTNRGVTGTTAQTTFCQGARHRHVRRDHQGPPRLTRTSTGDTTPGRPSRRRPGRAFAGGLRSPATTDFVLRARRSRSIERRSRVRSSHGCVPA